MKQLLIKKGKTLLEEVPAPELEPRFVRVKVAYSFVSPGTEISHVRSSGEPLWRRALNQPEKIKKAVDLARKQGLGALAAKVGKISEEPSKTGYSCSGTVVDVGEGVTDLSPGDRVACAGAGWASHAEIVVVPRNLVVKVPSDLGLDVAASVTLGAIALQGVRRADPRLGEKVAVIGLGLLGQMTAQFLKLSGCRVIGFDVDPSRVKLAQQCGVDRAVVVGEEDSVESALLFSEGYGVDCTIITAASSDPRLIQQSCQMTRRKGRIVVVGSVELKVERSPFYEKELDLMISCSYGPGRYDPVYEEGGTDYPYGYVRWTEQRNMEAYLQLLAERKFDLAPLVTMRCPFGEAPQAYEALQQRGERPLGVLLEYRQRDTAELLSFRPRAASKPALGTRKKGPIRLALVGAGGFATSMHLPNLERVKDFKIEAIVDQDGAKASYLSKKYGARLASTDFEEILADPEIEVVMICTRHHLHAPFALKALKAGKGVFVEKPMAMKADELDALESELRESPKPYLVGFNRRFSPAAQRAKALLSKRSGPVIINYRMNAGYLPPDHWTQGPEGGGRIVGEACHIFDLFDFLCGARPRTLHGAAIDPQGKYFSPRDNCSITVEYEDGSVATLLYTSMGAPEYPKEEADIYFDRKQLRLVDYKALEVYGSATSGWSSRTADKGHLEELQVFAKHIRDGNPFPIPLDSLVCTTRLSFLAERMVRRLDAPAAEPSPDGEPGS
ncbi:MAG: Gfo/Idh/MocA family oxidoreductase [bacterium]